MVWRSQNNKDFFSSAVCLRFFNLDSAKEIDDSTKYYRIVDNLKDLFLSDYLNQFYTVFFSTKLKINQLILNKRRCRMCQYGCQCENYMPEHLKGSDCGERPLRFQSRESLPHERTRLYFPHVYTPR